MKTTPEMEPPHSAEAERAVLGSIMLDTTGPDGDRVWDVCQSRGIVPESFFEMRNRIVYSAMQVLMRSGKPLDYVTILEALRTGGRLEAIGGAVYLQQLYDQTPTTAHAEYYIDIVRGKHLRRTVIECATRAIGMSYDEADYPDPQFVIGEAEKRLLEIDPCNGSSGLTWAQATDTAYDAIVNPKPGDRGIATGFKNLDAKIIGLKRGSLTIIAARPSVGKTAIALNIVENLALGEAKRPVGFFTLEMTTDQLTRRMITTRSHVNLWRYENGKIYDLTEKARAEAAIAKARDEIREAPIFPDETSSLDISVLRTRARQMKKQHGIDLIVVDYLQLMRCKAAERLSSKNLEVAEISGQLKSMAKELGIPVIALSQLNRNGDGKEPKLSDLRDSGSIEQDADIVILMHRKDEVNRTQVTLKVAKNRNGATGEINMNFDGAFYKFSEAQTAS